MYNKEQLEAINSMEGTVQVIASAGSGKSTVLIERICNLVKNHEIDQKQILAISFTNASATDLKTKLESKGLKNVSVGTFHSICKEILESQGYNNLFDSPKNYEVKRDIEIATGEKNVNIEDIMSWIGYQKSYMLDSKEAKFKFKESIYDVSFLRIAYATYEKYCKQKNCVDFDDWLITVNKIYNIKKVKSWDYVLVDECQDLSLVQHKLVNHFCSSNNIFEVGDINQCIYEFRGGVPELFKNFDKEHENTTVINMNTNYRSCNNIVEAANEFIRPYNSDYSNYKDTVADNKNDGIIECSIYMDKNLEAIKVVKKIEKMIENGVKPEDIAVLYRNNSNADCMESILKTKKIDYTISSNVSFFDKKEISGIIATLRLMVDSTDDEAFEILFRKCRFYPTTFFKGTLVSDLINESGKRDCSLYEAFMDHRWEKAWQGTNARTFIDLMSRLKIQNEKKLSIVKLINNIVKMFKIKEYIMVNYDVAAAEDKIESIENLKKFASGYEDVKKFLDFCSSDIHVKQKPKKNTIRLSTIHSCKGLEWENVFLIGLEDGKFPSEKSSDESEARLMYVAITRPRSNLYVSSIGSSEYYNKYKRGIDSYGKSTV